MNITRRDFLKVSAGAATGFVASQVLGGIRSGDVKDGALYKKGELVPKPGRYKCIVCGFIIEYRPGHIKNKTKFGICPVCFAGTEKGPKKPDEDFWQYIGK